MVFVAEECPTSRMTLTRLEPLEAVLKTAGGCVVAIHQDERAIAARTMRRCHATYTAVCEPAPYDTAAAYRVATLPTAFLIAADGHIADVVPAQEKGMHNRRITPLSTFVPPRRRSS